MNKLPAWMAEAVYAIKGSAGLGDSSELPAAQVQVLRQQVIEMNGGAIPADEEGLPKRIYDAMLDCLNYNDDLAYRGLTRQSVWSLVSQGKWRMAPARKPLREPKSKRMAETQESEAQESEWARQQDLNRAHSLRAMDEERWRRDAPEVPFHEWKRRHDLRLSLWMEHCRQDPKIPRLPIPPLLPDDTLDLKWTTRARPTPAIPGMDRIPLPLPAQEPQWELRESLLAIP